MSRALRFHVPGRPVPKQSFRAGPRPWQPKRVTEYARRVRAVAVAAAHHAGWVKPPADVPLAVTVRMGFARPKSARKADRERTSLRVVVPDIDNIVKAVLDPCSVLWPDDRQVSVLRCIKLTVPRREEGVTVTVEILANEESQLEVISGFAEG